MRILTIRPYLLFFLSTLFSLSIATDTLTPMKPLTNGETLISANGSFALGFFTPAFNSKNRYVGIWYNKISIQTVVWVANRKNAIVDSPGSLMITANGTLIITGNNSTVIWSSAVTAISNPIAQILDTGNFVVREANNDNSEIFEWQSFDHPTDTLLPGMKLGWNLTSGLNRNLTAWASLTDPSPGPYINAVDVHGDPQIFLWAGLTRKWRSGPWSELQFSGVPWSESISADFVRTSHEVYCTFNIRDPSIMSRLMVTPTGSVQMLVSLDQSAWTSVWMAPIDKCDYVSPCGPFGVCNAISSPICDCLQGFERKSPANWALGDGSDGCIRKMPLDCRNGTDGFVTVSKVKLPDTSSSTVDMSLSLEECRAKCLGNCSCTAYASGYTNGTGCIIWTTELTDIMALAFDRQDLHVRLASLGSTSDHSHNNTRVVIIAIVVPIVLGSLLLSLIGCYIWRKEKRRRAMSGTTSFTNPYNSQGAEAKDYELPLFDFDAIVAATDNFSGENKLGEGGFGPVFKGKLEDGQDIAVKRLAKTSFQGVDEFKNEIMLIAKLQHRNLVRLLGCCIQGEDRMLIYEYMPNKSLDVFLFDKAKCILLDWQTRYNIIMGTARGLLYLHQDSRLRIIHRDLKAGNVLLDKEMNPKISDFGTARIFGGDETEANTRKIVGTFGYMSPEYVMDGIFSMKSDVFSFGFLVLEIISGKKNRRVYLTKPDVNLLEHAWSLWKEGNGLELVDESMGYSFSMTEALRCINVGLLCVQQRRKDRPTMSSVVLMLGNESARLPYPERPGFVATRGPFEYDSSTRKEELFTVNDISVTTFDGR